MTSDQDVIDESSFQSETENSNSISSKNYLNKDGGAQSIRVGDEYQVSELPPAGSFRKQTNASKGNSVDPDNHSDQLYYQIWDPNKALASKRLDYIHKYCNYSKKEIAIQLLHERNYNANGLLAELKEIPPLDGSDWTDEDHHTYCTLIQETKQNIRLVSERMGKSLNNCMTVLFNTLKVRRTRSAKRKIGLILSEDPKPTPSPVKKESIHPEKDYDESKPIGRVDSPIPSKKSNRGNGIQHALIQKLSPELSDSEKKPAAKINIASSSDDDHSFGEESDFTDTDDEEEEDEEEEEEEENSNVAKKPQQTKRSDNLNETNKRQKKELLDPVEAWDSFYDKLVEYKKEHGHCLVPKVYKENQPLSFWVFQQRGLNRKKKLPQEHRRRLEKIGFIFYARDSDAQQKVDEERRRKIQDAKWEEMYSQLLDFKKETGHCLVPKVYEPNRALASWVFRQRAHKKAKSSQSKDLTKEKIKRLNDVGFVWDAKADEKWQQLDRSRKQPKADATWNFHYNELVKYFEKNGHTMVPKLCKDNKALGSWVSTQRVQWNKMKNGKPSRMTVERLAKLDRLNFVWDARTNGEWEKVARDAQAPRFEEQWNTYFEELKKFKKQIGHTLVPKNYHKNPGLAAWVFRQRAEYRKMEDGEHTRLTTERVQMLHSINFVFRVRPRK